MRATTLIISSDLTAEVNERGQVKIVDESTRPRTIIFIQRDDFEHIVAEWQALTREAS